MKVSYWIRGVFVCMFIAITLCYLCRNVDDADTAVLAVKTADVAPEPLDEEVLSPLAIALDPESDLLDIYIESDVGEASSVVAGALLSNPESDLAEDESLAELTGLLPAWMIERGALLQDRRDIFGRSVLRSRSRYRWDNGSSMEVEVSDVGSDADENVVRALGFDFLQATLHDEDGFTLVYDDGEVLTNQQYDYADQAGSLQVLIGGRYLVEIQLEMLPQESFQLVLDQQLSIDQLIDQLGKTE